MSLRKRRGRKPGSIYAHEYARQRKRDLESAEQAQDSNEGKVPVRMNARTVIMVDPAAVGYWEKKAREQNSNEDIKSYMR